jgi:hypothetical protein
LDTVELLACCCCLTSCSFDLATTAAAAADVNGNLFAIGDVATFWVFVSFGVTTFKNEKVYSDKTGIILYFYFKDQFRMNFSNFF